MAWSRIGQIDHSLYQFVQHCYELFYDDSFPKEQILFLSSNPGMASLLNDLDKLDAADNNTTEPDPTNVVAEDIDTNGSLVNVY